MDDVGCGEYLSFHCNPMTYMTSCDTHLGVFGTYFLLHGI
jgi:hypothetical protein